MVSEISLELPNIKFSDNLSCSLQVAYAYSDTHKAILIGTFLVLNTPKKISCAGQELLNKINEERKTRGFKDGTYIHSYRISCSRPNQLPFHKIYSFLHSSLCLLFLKLALHFFYFICFIFIFVFCEIQG